MLFNFRTEEEEEGKKGGEGEHKNLNETTSCVVTVNHTHRIITRLEDIALYSQQYRYFSI